MRSAVGAVGRCRCGHGVSCYVHCEQCTQSAPRWHRASMRCSMHDRACTNTMQSESAMRVPLLHSANAAQRGRLHAQPRERRPRRAQERPMTPSKEAQTVQNSRISQDSAPRPSPLFWFLPWRGTLGEPACAVSFLAAALHRAAKLKCNESKVILS